jgi:hypothetical protein
MTLAVLVLLAAFDSGTASIFDDLIALDAAETWTNASPIVDRLTAEANDSPIVCLELARRIGRPSVAAADITAMFRSDTHACHKNLVRILAVLQATDGDEVRLYGELGDEAILENPAFVRDVMLRRDRNKAALLARVIATRHLTEAAEHVSAAVVQRTWLPGEPIDPAPPGTAEPWELLFGACLLELRDETNRNVVDVALRNVRSSVEAVLSKISTEDDAMWLRRDFDDLLKRIKVTLRDQH